MASISFLNSAAKAIEAKGKPAYIHHFGDLDPSGVDAARDIDAKLRRYLSSPIYRSNWAWTST